MSLQEDLKKNDLYSPYSKKLDQLLKGGPGSGPQGGKGGKDESKGYKAARVKASKLSERADKERTGAGKVAAHAMAWKAHVNAAAKAPDNRVANQHTKMADFHNKMHSFWQRK